MPISSRGRRSQAIIQSLIGPPNGFASLVQRLRFDAIAVGVTDPSAPTPDSVLWANGFDHDGIVQWLASNRFSRDVECAESLDDAKAEEDSLQWLGNQKGIAVAIRDPHAPERLWWMVLGRQKGMFTSTDRAAAMLMLHRWQCQFLVPGQPVDLLLLDSGGALITSSLGWREKLLATPALAGDLMTQVQEVIKQRYPRLGGDDSHDCIVPLNGKPTWVRFQHCSAMPSAGTLHWVMEIRTIEDDQLPALGRVSDDRIASALAYLHDRFTESPSLLQIARHVHMSPFHFQRLFSSVVGISAKQYALRWQLQVARWELRDHHIPIAAIAENWGFSNHGHFTATFRRYVGLSPSEYRDRFAQ